MYSYACSNLILDKLVRVAEAQLEMYCMHMKPPPHQQIGFCKVLEFGEVLESEMFPFSHRIWKQLNNCTGQSMVAFRLAWGSNETHRWITLEVKQKTQTNKHIPWKQDAIWVWYTEKNYCNKCHIFNIIDLNIKAIVHIIFLTGEQKYINMCMCKSTKARQGHTYGMVTWNYIPVVFDCRNVKYEAYQITARQSVLHVQLF